MKAIRYPLTVFYDASCPMCASEMRALKDRDRDAQLDLVDCSARDFDDTVLAGTGITRADLMARLHARDAHGRWLVALDAIEAAYRVARLEPRQRAMLDFAVLMTRASVTIEEAHRADLRAHGFSDRDIWDIAAVASFFNMSNRMASAVDMRPQHAQQGIVPPQQPLDYVPVL